MDFSNEKGSATIEGAILLPMIFLIFLGLVLSVFQIYNKFCINNGLSQSLRVTAYDWYKDKNLYDDIIYDFNSSRITSNKFRKLEELYGILLRPTFKESPVELSMENYILYRRLVGKAGTIEARYPVFRGAVFIRNSQYVKELLDDAFSHLKENIKDNQEVYVVDDNFDEYEYNRIYHLYNDCSYLKGGYESKTTMGEGRAKGFRACRICLARKTGMD